MKLHKLIHAKELEINYINPKLSFIRTAQSSYFMVLVVPALFGWSRRTRKLDFPVQQACL